MCKLLREEEGLLIPGCYVTSKWFVLSRHVLSQMRQLGYRVSSKNCKALGNLKPEEVWPRVR